MTESAGLPCCSEDRKRRSACLVRAEECRTGDAISPLFRSSNVVLLIHVTDHLEFMGSPVGAVDHVLTRHKSLRPLQASPRRWQMRPRLQQ